LLLYSHIFHNTILLLAQVTRKRSEVQSPLPEATEILKSKGPSVLKDETGCLFFFSHSTRIEVIVYGFGVMCYISPTSIEDCSSCESLKVQLINAQLDAEAHAARHDSIREEGECRCRF
jgi:hypothetical protein